MKYKVTAVFVRTVKKPGRYGDGHGLYLLVTPTGARCWVQRLVIRGRRRELGLGGFPLVTLAEAREKAFDNRRLARSGGDPLTEKRKDQGVPTFEEAAARVIDIHRPYWKGGGKSEAQWEHSLRQYVFPRLGRCSVSEITTADVLDVLTPMWPAKNVTARRVRQRIGAVMKWAVAQGYRGDNPAGDAIDAALPRNGLTKKHMKALPHGEVTGAVEAVRNSECSMVEKLAFEFLVLTACRSGEVLSAAWSEIDLEAREWNIPGERMKAKRPHRVPLSGRALEVLNGARTLSQDDDGTGPVFPSTINGKPLPGMSKMLRALDIKAVPHGFRSSFRDWAAEQTNHSREVMEAALAHVVDNQTEAAYARSDLFDRRRKLMDDWAAYLNAGTEGEASRG